MEILNTPEEIRRAALANSPAFNAVFRAAPASLMFNGQAYARATARTVEEKLWYLSALAILEPEAVYELADQPLESFSLDADDSAVRAAQAKLRAAEALVRTKEAALVRIKADLQHAIDQDNACDDGANLAGAVLTLGASFAICKAEFAIMIQQRRGGVATVEGELAAAKTAVENAKQDVTAAQANYNADNAKIRAEEERVRAELNKQELKEAEAKRDEALRRAAEAKATAESKAAAERATRAAEEAARQAAEPTYAEETSEPWPVNCEAYGDCDNSGSDLHDPWGEFEVDPALGGDSYYSDAVAAQLYGDEQMTAEALDDQGETPPRACSGPYDFDRYYTCASGNCAESFDATTGEMFNCDDDEECEQCAHNSHGLDSVYYGAEGEGWVAVLAGVLAVAPAVINAFAAPAGDASRNEKAATDEVLKRTGIQDKIDKAAKDSGEAAGAKISGTVAAVGVGLAILLIKLLS